MAQSATFTSGTAEPTQLRACITHQSVMVGCAFNRWTCPVVRRTVSNDGVSFLALVALLRKLSHNRIRRPFPFFTRTRLSTIPRPVRVIDTRQRDNNARFDSPRLVATTQNCPTTSRDVRLRGMPRDVRVRQSRGLRFPALRRRSTFALRDLRHLMDCAVSQTFLLLCYEVVSRPTICFSQGGTDGSRTSRSSFGSIFLNPPA